MRSYRNIDTTAAWQKLRFNLPDSSDLHMTDNLSIAAHAFASRVLMALSVDETCVNMAYNDPRYQLTHLHVYENKDKFILVSLDDSVSATSRTH